MEKWVFSEELKERKEKLEREGYDAYCLFCLAGTEITLANEMNNNYDHLIALPVLKMAHRSRNGNRYDVQEPLISSYIFVFLNRGRDIFKVRTSRFHFRVLNKDNDKGILAGDDLRYAKWVLSMGGLISVSEAINLNGKVKIITGPLKNLEGNIVKYDKRNRNCLIEIDFLGRRVSTWLPFDFVDMR